jgi:predicted nuclease of predicted toxin-antitoxin system
MKLKLDENLPESLISALSELGHDVDSVALEGLAGYGDGEIWKAAQRAGRLFITQDLDFSDARKFAPGTHFSLILIRLRFPSRIRLAQRIREIFRSEQVETWARGFVVVTDLKIRPRLALGESKG